MTIRAILFDAYGTLAHIARPTRPYLRLQRAARIPVAEFAQVLTQSISLEELARRHALSTELLAQAQADLEQECASITLYPDALPALSTLRARGLKVGICSNLALPYAAPLLALLPPLDATIWSFEAGYAKPHPQIYMQACRALGCLPHEVLMVGDTYKADVEGPRMVGMQARWLQREGGGDLTSLAQLIGVLDGIL